MPLSVSTMKQTTIPVFLQHAIHQPVQRSSSQSLPAGSRSAFMAFWTFFCDLVSTLRLIIYRMSKRARRLFTGQTGIARICAGEPSLRNNDGSHSSHMTAEFWQEWSTSKKMKDTFQTSAANPQMNVAEVATSICTEKHITEATISNNVRHCLEEIKGVNALVEHVEALSSTKFDADNEEHEEKLERLWTIILPGVERKDGRYTREWGRIGFQQSDPQSDFRGGGILALDQLLFIATSRNSIVRKMISEPKAEIARYPWACVGINLTFEAVRILKSRAIDRSLYGKDIGNAMATFNELYSDMFEILHHRWLKANPENLLAFPEVKKDTLQHIDEEIKKTGSLVPPGSSA